MGHCRVKVLAEFIVHDDWDAKSIIEHALSESDGVSFVFSVAGQSAFPTPVTDEDMGDSCDGCKHEGTNCPCEACDNRCDCCGSMDAERRSKCVRYLHFNKGG